tara:strand:- start:4117 stop:5709 length:1593 start_codon:yes stop_codon:yes gene_type:complete
MGLINLQTNLRSLSYGSGRGEPYVTQPLPAYDEDPGNRYLGADMFGRSGQLQRGLTDVTRLTKYLESGKGLLFNVKQIALERTRPKTPYGPKRNFLFSTILAQAGVSGTGIHWDRTNSLIIEEDEKYLSQTLNKYNNRGEENTNRLTLLYDSKITKLKSGGKSAKKFSLTDNQNQTTLFQYGGGPNSVGGIGNTIGLRISNTTEYKPGSKGSSNEIKSADYSRVFVLTNEQIGLRKRSTSTGFNTDSGIKNFITDIPNTEDSKRVIGRRRTNYSNFNRSKTFGTGEYSPNVDKQAYYDDVPNPKSAGVDKINIKSIYKSSNARVNSEGTKDLIKFYIAVIDNDNPINKTYIHFRAYISGLSDNYSANWNASSYPGRGEEFFKYQGFSRDIGFSFQVHVGSRAELFPVYNKLNYLASIMAPDYSSPGFMRGNIVQLTVGDYINDMYGIITNFNYTIPDEATWDIARTDGGAVDSQAAELPTLINVESFSFKPIHNFIPRTVKDLDNPESRFISLGNASNGKGYGENKRGLK